MFFFSRALFNYHILLFKQKQKKKEIKKRKNKSKENWKEAK
jgi:hypothetical protein